MAKMGLFTLNDIEIILLITFGTFFFIQILFYLCIYNRVHSHNKKVKKNKVEFETKQVPVSVIVCVRNESENLRKHLPAILEQDYPEFEVIVVNDSSSDDSEDILTIMAEKYPHLYHTFTPDSSRYISKKKLALTVGIKASKYDWLLFTEPNCYPASKDWLKLMARNFTSQTDIVLGYSGYEYKKGWKHLKTSFDNLFFSLRYLGFALIRKPYMGIGRNLAYRKELFFKNKGYSSHLNLQRGDDDLFINKLATSSNTRVETAPDAIMRILPIEYRKIWKEDKVNYTVTSHYFKGLQKYWLGFETLSRLLFYGLFIALICISILNHQWILTGIAAFIYLLRYLIQIIVINKAAKDVNERRYYLTLPVFDIIQPIYNFRFKLIRLFRRKNNFMRRQ